VHTRKRRFQVTNSQIVTVLVLLGLVLGPLGAIPVAAGPPGGWVQQ
jgi:hypothetical protein